MTQSRIILSIFGVLAVFMIGFTYFYARSAYPSGECQNTEVSRVTAPSGTYDAVIFQRRCGDEAEPSAHVSVLPAGAALENAFGNAVILKGEPGEVYGPLVWSGDVLAVKLNSSEVLSVSTNPVEGVEVRLTKG